MVCILFIRHRWSYFFFSIECNDFSNKLNNFRITKINYLCEHFLVEQELLDK